MTGQHAQSGFNPDYFFRGFDHETTEGTPSAAYQHYFHISPQDPDGDTTGDTPSGPEPRRIRLWQDSDCRVHAEDVDSGAEFYNLPNYATALSDIPLVQRAIADSFERALADFLHWSRGED